MGQILGIPLGTFLAEHFGFKFPFILFGIIMGQQQLLLVILVTIIVGIATVVAINTFSSAADSANLDAVRQDLAQIASSAQAYYIKPTMLGGGGNDWSTVTFNNITFPSDSIFNSGLSAANTNGSYVMTTRAAGQLVVTATPASGAVTSIVATITPDNMSQATNQ
jgi:Tfp pilus assembly protein PilE